MIEMLGVLAIIGVLSAGGIMGYTVAMENYRLNKTVDLIQQIVSGSINIFTKQMPQNIIITYDKMAQLGILTADQIKDTVPCTEWGNGYEQKLTCFLSPMKTMMTTAYYSPKDGHKGARVSINMYEVSKKDCIKLVSHNWTGIAPHIYIVAHDHSWATGSIYNRTLTPSDATTYCGLESGYFRIWFYLNGKAPYTTFYTL